MTLNERITALEERLRAADEHLSVKRNALMARYTTLHLGGLADILVSPDRPEQIPMVLKAAHELEVPVIVIGNGSNLLVRDGGIRGLVLRMCRDMQDIELRGNTIRAEAGTMMSTLSMAAAQANLAGLTFASGIPGTVGGGVHMNAGAYGGEISHVCTHVTVMTRAGAIRELTAAQMLFSYRHSAVMESGDIVISADFRLQPKSTDEIRAVMKDLMGRRSASQPLDLPSAGSAFKRPVGGYAGALIEQAGLKGFRVGNAAISTKHAGFAVNLGGATAADVKSLLQQVSDIVYEKSGIRLEPEVQIW